MLFRSLLGYGGYGQQTAARPRPARQRPRARPSLEALEDRALLSTFVVDRLTDAGAGAGLAGDLRYCINQANTLPGDDAITFAVTGTINLTGALPSLRSNIDLQGPGAASLTVRRDTGGWAYRIFTVARGATVVLSGLTITNGFVYNSIGGGIDNAGTLTLNNATVSGNSAVCGGGGIDNAGTLTLNNTTVSGNGAFYPGGGEDYSSGGGILNSGTVTLNNATVSGNDADYGGGIANFGTVTLNNATVSGNSAGGIANGGRLTLNNTTVSGNYSGGIYNEYRATLTLNNATVSGNSATFSGGGIYNNGGTLTTRNTLLAGNTAPGAPDLWGSLGSRGHNLIGNTSGGSGFHETDLLDVAPLLGPLQDNGGPTLTHALLPGSPAIDAGDNTDAPEWDQRGEGFPRLVNDVIDVGAFEVQVGPATWFWLDAPAAVPSGATFDVTLYALDDYGHLATGYRGTVAFGSSDKAATLPAPYTFRPEDNGIASFPGGVALRAPGPQELVAFDLETFSVIGDAVVEVLGAAPAGGGGAVGPVLDPFLAEALAGGSRPARR
jgi:hypothetical protein